MPGHEQDMTELLGWLLNTKEKIDFLVSNDPNTDDIQYKIIGVSGGRPGSAITFKVDIRVLLDKGSKEREDSYYNNVNTLSSLADLSKSFAAGSCSQITEQEDSELSDPN
jgi:hypothetical protein